MTFDRGELTGNSTIIQIQLFLSSDSVISPGSFCKENFVKKMTDIVYGHIVTGDELFTVISSLLIIQQISTSWEESPKAWHRILMQKVMVRGSLPDFYKATRLVFCLICKNPKAGCQNWPETSSIKILRLKAVSCLGTRPLRGRSDTLGQRQA